ncbi:MAG TPA: LacI family DNA-binding transcriptional regulator [Pyrinomonadaceae bacterium]|jgi:LacI family transcriptional regulator
MRKIKPLLHPSVLTPAAVRIKDVAREASVSTATVSHVINQTKYVTDATRQKVLRAIEKYNYYPNAHARTLASGRSNIIGLVVSDISNPFFPELVKSMAQEAFLRGYNVLLVDTNYDADRAALYVRRMIELKVSGVALMTAELDPQLLDDLVRKHVPVIFNDLGLAREHMSNIVLDYAVGIEEAVRHLVSLGHKKIAHIAGSSSIRSGMIRREAFLDSMARHLPGEPTPAIYEADFKFEGGRRAAREIMDSATQPTGVVVANDLMALGAMQELRKAGVSIPQDISIVGFDDISFAALAEPPLTTVCSPRDEIGRRAIEELSRVIERPDQRGVEIRIPTYLIIRRSTAPPKIDRE